ncbi:hypothetical protein ART_0198 [Arthrobacter sp. PAMC 25486]|uniref:hypothetical protein n=1 Tax=Arthrobacter sp. PAMC 25486 TaxID=1494608 RepID=UPI000535B3AE|nr:hypothetical protein [Arthrobacter sp. PAMC 25486]AIX99796.1 hypothetical protein ART_0198 [Arthrobacter sp. PAMC 25486]
MARDRANIRTDMLGADAYRSLSMAEQHLYKLLMIHSTLSYAGVAEWKPGKLAATASDLTKESVRAAGNGLQSKHFIYVDEETEEVFIRSFVRHDGLLKQHRLPVSMANNYTDISSSEIRQFFVHELRRLFEEYPEYKCWEIDRVKRLLKNPSKDMKSMSHADAHGATHAMPDAAGYAITEEPGYGSRTATATATATSSKEDKREAPQKRGTRIPEDFQLTAEMSQWAASNAPNVDINLETMKFKNHWESKAGRDATKLDWIKTWRNWILNSRSNAATTSKPSTMDRIRNTVAAGQALQAQSNQNPLLELGE